jgi:hypothetical protein
MTVTGGERTMWVRTEDCRLPNGDLAFPNDQGLSPPLPGWLGHPAEGLVRRESKKEDMAAGFPFYEVRSMPSTAGNVLDFYENVARQGGLVRMVEPQVGRAGPGFRFEDDEHTFGVEAFERDGTTFWTIQLGNKSHLPKMKPNRLELIRQDCHRAMLRYPRVAIGEIWASVSAFNDHDPWLQPSNSGQTRPVQWSVLPDWVQFNFDAGGESRPPGTISGTTDWNASVSAPFKGNPASAFEACLDLLDSQRFDGTSRLRTERTYYVSVLQWGHSRNARIHAEQGAKASLTVLNTLGIPSLFIRYIPPPGTPLPELPR